MKKSLLGSFVGISIVLSLDSLSRVIIALYMNEEIPMFSYSAFPDLIWPIVLLVVAAFSSFFGAMFALTYGREKRIVSLILYTVLIGVVRYGQILILKDSDEFFYPLIALILSLITDFLAWKVTRPKKEAAEPEPVSQKHHHPGEDDEPQNPPQ